MEKEETMAWSEMANKAVNTWAETGTQMWKSWLDLMGSAYNKEGIAASNSYYQEVQERFLNNQQLLMRFLSLSVKAWQDIFPKVESGDNWQETLNKYTEEMRNQLSNYTSGAIKINQDAAELWQLYIKEMQKFSQLSLDPLGMFIAPTRLAMTGNSSAWIELNNHYWNLLYEESFGSLMKSPILGPTREFNGKLLAGFEAWKNLYKASINYQIVLADIQVRSFEALMGELVTKAEKGDTVQNWRQFQQIWSEVSDTVFEEAFCQEENLKIRGNFINALNSYRLKQQELMELSMKMMNMPVRSEIDEIHKTIYELRKEVKTLKKALAKYEETPE